MYFETAAWEMEKPSFKSSPWIRGAPHRVFSRDIRRTRWRISLDTGGRPGFLRRDFHVQKSLNPLRCQPMTVSGLTITRAWRQPGHRQDRMTQKTLSAFRSDGRGLFRFRTATGTVNLMASGERLSPIAFVKRPLLLPAIPPWLRCEIGEASGGKSGGAGR